MITIIENKSLRYHNTFGFNQCAEHYVEVSTKDQLEELVRYAQAKSWPVFILGGGSNIVLTRDIPGLVIHMVGAQVDHRTDEVHGSSLVTAAAGKNWHEFVIESLHMGLQGLENLSLIPGSVGAAPVQNIGAYGVEIKDRISRVRALHIPTCTWHDFTQKECSFSYRHSYFKENPNQYAIAEVEFSLGSHHAPETSYHSLATHLAARNLSMPSALEISQSVVSIRASKLPDPSTVGNAGSFFHNPVVNIEAAQALKHKFPDLVTFEAEAGLVKLSAGWLIDQLGYRGFTREGVGVYQHQALVLIHEGGSTGRSLLRLAEEIMAKVESTYNVTLSIEPLVI